MYNQYFTCFLYGGEYCFFIQRDQGTDIDDFNIPSVFFCQTIGCLQAKMGGVSVSDDTQIAAFSADTCFTERYLKIVGHNAGCVNGVVQGFGFQKQGNAFGAHTGT